MKEDKIDPTLTEEVAPPVENPGLSLNDITACVSIIDIVTKRGAFEGPEMADVGAVRNRLAAFLDAAKAAQEPARDQPTDQGNTDAE
jgi:ribosome maturation factor RimP